MLKILQTAILASALVPASSMAALVIEVYELNGSTVFEATGTIDLTGVSYIEVDIGEDTVAEDGETIVSSVAAAQGILLMTSPLGTPITMHLYQSAFSPIAFGTGGGHLATGYEGGGSPNFGLSSDDDHFHGILLSEDFVHGSTFSQTMVFAGMTLEQLGIEVGIYEWSWSNGETATLDVIGIIPEPSTYAALAGLALCGLLAVRRFRARA